MADAIAPDGAAGNPTISHKRSIAKAVSWRVVGSLDTLVLSWVLITYLGPAFGLEHSPKEAAKTAGLIAATEVATKIALYYLHERGWEWLRWGTSMQNGRRREAYWRTVAKTASWRITASLDTTLLAWMFTGNVATALSIGGLEVLTKLVLYFLHERAWTHVRYGIASGAAGVQASSEREASVAS